MQHCKEIVYVRPHVAKFIKWYEKLDTPPVIQLSKGRAIANYCALLPLESQYAFTDEKDLPPQYSEKVEIIIDVPVLISKKLFFITNDMTVALDGFCHSLFLDFVAEAIAQKEPNSSRKAARAAFLKRISVTDDDIDEDTVRRLLDFLSKNERKPKTNNNSIIKHRLKSRAHKSPPLTVLNLFS